MFGRAHRRHTFLQWRAVIFQPLKTVFCTWRCAIAILSNFKMGVTSNFIPSDSVMVWLRRWFAANRPFRVIMSFFSFWVLLLSLERKRFNSSISKSSVSLYFLPDKISVPEGTLLVRSGGGNWRWVMRSDSNPPQHKATDRTATREINRFRYASCRECRKSGGKMCILELILKGYCCRFQLGNYFNYRGRLASWSTCRIIQTLRLNWSRAAEKSTLTSCSEWDNEMANLNWTSATLFSK